MGRVGDDGVVRGGGTRGGAYDPAAVRTEARAEQDGRAARAAPGRAATVEEVIDLGESRVDPDELGTTLLRQVVAKGAATVHLDHQAAQVAELRVARPEQGAPLAPEQARVRPSGSDALGVPRDGVDAPAMEQRHSRSSVTSSAEGTTSGRAPSVGGMAMCHICRRTLLAGERYRAWRGRGRDRTVCVVCEPAALRAGWLRLVDGFERVSVLGISATVRRVA